MNQRQRDRVNGLLESHLTNLGVKVHQETPIGREYTLSTPSGLATVQLIGWQRRGGRDRHVPWLACRFEDPGKARANGLDCNPFTGKYNCHVSNANRTAEEVMAVFVDHLDRMLTAGKGR